MSTASATFALEVEDGLVVGCALYARKWALGRRLEDLLAGPLVHAETAWIGDEDG